MVIYSNIKTKTGQEYIKKYFKTHCSYYMMYIVDDFYSPIIRFIAAIMRSCLAVGPF